MNEDALYKNYLHHPIWKGDANNVKYLFKMKGWDLRKQQRGDTKLKAKEDIIAGLLNSKQQVLFWQIDKDHRERALILRYLTKEMDSLILYRTTTNTLRWVEDEREMSVEILSISGSSRLYFVMYKDSSILKYVYSILPFAKIPTPKRILKGMLSSPKEELKEGSNLNLATVEMLVQNEILRMGIERPISIDRVNEFLTTYEEKDESYFPKSMKFYFLTRKNGLPEGWKAIYDFGSEEVKLRYNKVIVVENAYVKNKITALKVPIWIEKIYLTLGNTGLTQKSAVGFHNDLSGTGGNMNILASMCTGDIPINTLLELTEQKDAEGINNLLNKLTRGMSVTNLDHPYWQYGGIPALKKIQVIGESDKRRGDEEVVAEVAPEMIIPVEDGVVGGIINEALADLTRPRVRARHRDDNADRGLANAIDIGALREAIAEDAVRVAEHQTDEEVLDALGISPEEDITSDERVLPHEVDEELIDNLIARDNVEPEEGRDIDN